jgi:hypothetical protein
MSAAGVEAPRLARAESADAPPAALQRGLAFGVLAMAPLFVVYEIVQRTGATGARNTAEYLLMLPFAALGEHAANVRALLLVAVLGICAWRCFHAELGLFGRIGRVVLEGFVAAVVLGPLLILLENALALPVPPLAAASAPALADTLRHASGAAFEEIVFRVGLQSAFFVLGLELCLFFTGERRVARVLAECGSIALGALVFSAAHLAPVVGLFGTGGEAPDARVFAWRAIAGVALGVLYRVRGPGVAAWTHAFFNVALFIGAGPDVLL